MKGLVGIIPARAGSKRILSKNKKKLAGIPLIEYTIKAAFESGCFKDLVLSTDDDDLIEMYQEDERIVVFRRDMSLGSDLASSDAVLLEVLQSLDPEGKKWKFVSKLQPTSPLRSIADIQGGIQFWQDCGGDAVISVFDAGIPEAWSKSFPATMRMDAFLEGVNKTARSQDQRPLLSLNGALYLAKTKSFLHEKSFFLKENVFAYQMPSSSSIDIDTQEDWELVEDILYGRRWKRENQK